MSAFFIFFSRSSIYSVHLIVLDGVFMENTNRNMQQTAKKASEAMERTAETMGTP